MDFALRFAYLLDVAWFLLFTYVLMLLVAALILLRGWRWLKPSPRTRGRRLPKPKVSQNLPV